ncbi:hypothetical protein [uncultured Litoreibacter sp.]|uniref:hypothetical protein n=1 Tax=uncultured Litoreibacter sp. TaxID=1392394 RepID=UPI002632CD78|nr:hypothetical protein [uncultured Litoreibacter sp.]
MNDDCTHLLNELVRESHLLRYLIESVEVRPGMYVASGTANDLYKHLLGWKAHRSLVEDGDVFADRFFLGFGDFVSIHFRDAGAKGLAAKGWGEMIAGYTADPAKELEAFFGLLREFTLSNSPP